MNKARVELAEGALRAQDENARRQLEELGLTDQFPSLTHLASDMGEALRRLEKRLAVLENEEYEEEEEEEEEE